MNIIKHPDKILSWGNTEYLHAFKKVCVQISAISQVIQYHKYTDNIAYVCAHVHVCILYTRNMTTYGLGISKKSVV